MTVDFTSDKYKVRPKQQYTLSCISEVYDIVESSLYENDKLIEYIDMKNVDIDDPVNRCVLKITPNGCYTVFRLDFKDDDYSSVVSKRNTSYPQITKVNNTNYFYFPQYNDSGRGLYVVYSNFPQLHRVVNVTMRVKIPDSSNYSYPIISDGDAWNFDFSKENAKSRLWFSIKNRYSSTPHYYSSKIFFDEEVFYDLRFVIHASCDDGHISWLDGVDIYVNNELIMLYDSDNNDHYTANHTSFYSSSSAYLSFDINDYSDSSSKRLYFEYVYAFDSEDIPKSSYKTRNWVFEKEQPNQYDYKLITVDNYNQSNIQSLTVNVVDGMIFYSTKQYPCVGERYQLILSDPTGDSLNNYVIEEGGVVAFSGTTRNTSLRFRVNSTESRTYLYVATVTNDYGSTYTLKCIVNVIPSNINDLFLRLCPNFGATKSLEYKTQVLTSYTHTEDRLAQRESPRMYFKYNYSTGIRDSYYGFLDNVRDLGLTTKVYVPDWVCALRVSDTDNITLPSTHEFFSGDDVLVYKDFYTYELVPCSINNNVMSLETEDVYTDCLVVPIYVCYLDKSPKFSSDDFEHSVEANFVTAIPNYKKFTTFDKKYLGHDLLLNFKTTNTQVDREVTQDIITTDYDIGLRSVYTLNDRTFESFDITIACNNSELHDVINFIKRRYGKKNSFFVSLGDGAFVKDGYAKNDLITNTINIKTTNHNFTDRPYICINLRNGDYVCAKVVSINDEKTTITIDTTLNVKSIDIIGIDTLLFVRLDDDKIDIKLDKYDLYKIKLDCVETKFYELSSDLQDKDVRSDSYDI